MWGNLLIKMCKYGPIFMVGILLGSLVQYSPAVRANWKQELDTLTISTYEGKQQLVYFFNGEDQPKVVGVFPLQKATASITCEAMLDEPLGVYLNKFGMPAYIGITKHKLIARYQTDTLNLDALLKKIDIEENKSFLEIPTPPGVPKYVRDGSNGQIP